MFDFPSGLRAAPSPGQPVPPSHSTHPSRQSPAPSGPSPPGASGRRPHRHPVPGGGRQGLCPRDRARPVRPRWAVPRGGPAAASGAARPGALQAPGAEGGVAILGVRGLRGAGRGPGLGAVALAAGPQRGAGGVPRGVRRLRGAMRGWGAVWGSHRQPHAACPSGLGHQAVAAPRVQPRSAHQGKG